MKVCVLVISHRHGVDFSVYANTDLANAALESYCDEWWEDRSEPGPKPEDRKELVSRYFEMNDDEWAELDERDVIEDAPPQA